MLSHAEKFLQVDQTKSLHQVSSHLCKIKMILLASRLEYFKTMMMNPPHLEDSWHFEGLAVSVLLKFLALPPPWI